MTARAMVKSSDCFGEVEIIMRVEGADDAEGDVKVER